MTSEKIRALIVDDDFDARHLLKFSLGRTIEVVGEADTGGDAIRQLSRLRPDLILLDIHLPDTSGVDVLRAAKQALPDVVVVMVSGVEDPETLNQAYAAGAASVVRKPYSKKKVQEAVAQALQRHLASVAPPRPGDPDQDRGQLWSFCRATGGTGQTTLALTMAQHLANKGYRTVVVDLDLAFGHLNLYLKLDNPSPTLVDLHEGRNLFRDNQIFSLLRTHGSKLKVVSGPTSLDLAYDVPTEMILQVVERLRVVCDYVLLDLPAGIPTSLLSLVEASDELMLVASDRPGAIHGMGRILEVLGELQNRGVEVHPVMTGWRGQSDTPAPSP